MSMIYKKGDIKIDRSELLRYIGYKPGMDISGFEPEIAACAQSVLAACAPRHTVGRYGIVSVPEGIAVQKTALVLEGKSLAEHLAGCGECFLLAATLGGEVEREISRLGLSGLGSRLFADAAATAAIESYCDFIEDSLRETVKKEGLSLTARFSPGYGDLPLEAQAGFIKTLDTSRKIGLTLTPEMIMLPRKSVTAVIGISRMPGKFSTGRECDTCTQKHCPYRKEVPHDV